MSLTWRFLLVLLLLNLGVLGVVQWTSYSWQERWLEDHRQVYQDFFERRLPDVYSPARMSGPAEQRVRSLLELQNLQELFKDVLVTDGRSRLPEDVNLNLYGAIHRDPHTFPREEVMRGLARARDESVLVPAGDGFCVPIQVGNEVSGAIWVSPLLPPPPQLPLGVFAIPLVVASALFGLLAYWSIRRSVVQPLRQLGSAAVRVGGGEYAARVPQMNRARELSVLVDAFNSMAQKIEGHTEELGEKVRGAVAEAERKERALVVSSRLAAMGTLAAGIAHEINNPIGGMLNAVHRLMQKPELTEKERTYLALVRDGLERVGRTTRRMLDFSPRKIEPERFRLGDAVDGARALVEHRLSFQGVNFDCRLAEDLPALEGDPHEIQQVLLNLFINSLDALGSGSGTITVRGSADRDQVELLVADDGPGMAAADLARVMDPFFSAKGEPEASGLGMFISYTIVQNHGGHMEVESAPGEGFRVRIRMPAVAPEATGEGLGNP